MSLESLMRAFEEQMEPRCYQKSHPANRYVAEANNIATSSTIQTTRIQSFP